MTQTLSPAPARARAKATSSTLKASKEPPKGKGKGKATQWDSDEEEDEDDAYVTSNDFHGTPERRPTRIPKPVERFGDVGGDDDEEVYGVGG